MTDVDVRRIVGEVAARHGVRLDAGDPLMVALTANAVVLESVAAQLMAEARAVAERLERARVAVPEEARAALVAAAERSAEKVRSGLAADVEGAGLKARAIVDAVYRAQSRAAMWRWMGVGLVAGAAMFVMGFAAGRVW